MNNKKDNKFDYQFIDRLRSDEARDLLHESAIKGSLKYLITGADDFTIRSKMNDRTEWGVSESSVLVVKVICQHGKGILAFSLYESDNDDEDRSGLGNLLWKDRVFSTSNPEVLSIFKRAYKIHRDWERVKMMRRGNDSLINAK